MARLSKALGVDAPAVPKKRTIEELKTARLTTMDRDAKLLIQRELSAAIGAQEIQKQVDAEAQMQATRDTAAAQVAETNRQRQEQQQAMLNLQREQQNLSANARADLTAGDGSPKIVAGGTADTQASEEGALKKKLKVAGLSTTLGVNV